MPSVSKGMKESVPRHCWLTRGRHARILPLDKALRLAAGPSFFQRVGAKGCHDRTTSGQDAQYRTQGRSAQHGWHHAFEVVFGGPGPDTLDVNTWRSLSLLGQVADDFAVAKYAHGDDDETDAVGRSGIIKTVPGHTRVHVGTHHAQ